MTSLLAAAVLSRIAWRLRGLTRDGAVAACIVGAAVLRFGGGWWAAALVVFFASGTALTAVGRARKTQPEHRGGGRSAPQVLGAGGVAAAISVVSGLEIVPDPLRGALRAAFVGALATAAADTWATELGMLSPAPPRLITTREVVPAGTSGGVSLVGAAAGLAGSAVVAAVAARGNTHLSAAAVIAGMLAMFLDSLLGATVQGSYRQPDGSLSEESGAGAVLARGSRWITNPVVNGIATLAGAVLAAVLSHWA
jgi:uncharacterized protein (TIGR00297 family)